MNVIKELDMKHLAQYLKPRPKECHKGDFGRVLIIGGDLGYSGAVRLAGEAALRVGAGSVSIATRPEHAVSLNVSCPELMCHGISNVNDLNKLLEQATFIVIGPGFGTNKWSLSLLRAALKHKDKSMLLDADALNRLAVTKIKMKRDNCIFTPHPGEAARLLNSTPQKIQKNRLVAIHELYELLGGTIVLKGSGTLILSELNQAEICHAGNPGMATAGMGDVLSGIIAGLAAQNIPLDDAAKLGVLVHAMAGDLSAAEKGERGMIASDLILSLRGIVNHVTPRTLRSFSQ
ncbi:MAG: NAD(P)H-hydrate dehydratase [Legionellaceae bacterium]|nr:NAD(P)H-hydrate dehydratase [Legionellaceae bacterium]